VTDASGRFLFRIAVPLLNTRFQVVAVAAPGGRVAKSSTLVERVAVRVNLHLRSAGHPGFARMYGTVTPAEIGAPVEFQLMRRGLAPLTVARTKVRRARPGTSQFSGVVRIRRRGLYRALVRVAGGRQVSGNSRSLLVR
jgi:hypothetical protein